MPARGRFTDSSAIERSEIDLLFAATPARPYHLARPAGGARRSLNFSIHVSRKDRRQSMPVNESAKISRYTFKDPTRRQFGANRWGGPDPALR